MTEEQNAKETGTPDLPKNLKPYFLGLLRRGPRWNETQGPEATGLMERQLSYLRERSEAGDYLAAGPVVDQSELSAVLLIAADTYQAALQLAQNDPGVLAGRLVAEVHPVLLPDLSAVRTVYKPSHNKKTKSGN